MNFYLGGPAATGPVESPRRARHLSNSALLISFSTGPLGPAGLPTNARPIRSHSCSRNSCGSKGCRITRPRSLSLSLPPLLSRFFHLPFVKSTCSLSFSIYMPVIRQLPNLRVFVLCVLTFARLSLRQSWRADSQPLARQNRTQYMHPRLIHPAICL